MRRDWSARAFRELRSGRPRPVGLELPPDMLAARAEVELLQPLAAEPEPPLDEDAVERAADLLAKAECPVIFVGGGALEAADEVRTLAERLTAPVVAYRRGKGVLDERHPLSHALPGGHALWPKADVVLAVGTRLQLPLAAWGTDDKLKVIKVDVDPRRARPRAQARDRPRRRRRPRARAAHAAPWPHVPDAARSSRP